jgi:RNA polymerase sigma factor (sigma-70 family)
MANPSQVSEGAKVVTRSELLSYNDPSPDEILDSKDKIELVSKILEDMDEEDRDILIRRFYKNEIYEKSAKKYGCTKEAVRLKLNSALDKFKWKLKEKVSLSDL